jgi:hypothetical protein
VPPLAKSELVTDEAADVTAADVAAADVAGVDVVADGVPAPDVVAAVRGLGRSTLWELVERHPLSFPTHHPQGLAFVGDRTFVSSVEITEEPRRAENPADRKTGAGVGHLFVLENGRLVYDLTLGEGAIYHPGGIDFDGENVWMSVAEYRADSMSIVVSVDPVSLEICERFRVDDHIGWVVRDPARDLIYGGTWGSRRFYTWTPDGRELDRWENPSSFVDYQDSQYVAPGLVLCSGIAIVPEPSGGRYELGGIALVDILNRRIVHELPVPVFSDAGHVLTRNPFAVTADAAGLWMHVAPDDGDDLGGTQLFSFLARPR